MSCSSPSAHAAARRRSAAASLDERAQRGASLELLPGGEATDRGDRDFDVGVVGERAQQPCARPDRACCAASRRARARPRGASGRDRLRLRDSSGTALGSAMYESAVAAARVELGRALAQHVDEHLRRVGDGATAPISPSASIAASRRRVGLPAPASAVSFGVAAATCRIAEVLGGEHANLEIVVGEMLDRARRRRARRGRAAGAAPPSRRAGSRRPCSTARRARARAHSDRRSRRAP